MTLVSMEQIPKKVSVQPVYYSRFKEFSKLLSRPDFVTKITKNSPWVCFSNEFGVSDLSAAGGLGYLAGDWSILAGKLGIPFVGIGLYYEYKWKQRLDNQFLQSEEFIKAPEPEFYNFEKISVRLPNYYSNGTETAISVYGKDLSGNLLLMLHEKGIRSLYEGHKQTEHRLYQSAVLGFIGIQALFKLEIGISILHLNESSTVFAGIAWIDMLLEQGLSLDNALRLVKEHTIFTNHTLSPAAESVWTMEQMNSYIFRNIKSSKLLIWLTDLITAEGGKIRLSSLAMKISGHSNAVSKLHALKANVSYKTKFESVTNAIANRWIYPEVLHTYRELGLGDPTIDVLPANFRDKLKMLNIEHMLEVKQHAKEDLCNYLLSERQDQYGRSVSIPENATILLWARRFDSYKRPGLIFSDPTRLANMLEKYQMHMILSGKAHQTDEAMKRLLQKILRIVDQNEILKKRVHFIVNYNWQLTRNLGGADIILNTPVPGWEACGTSWEKAVANWILLCSTRDGGAADVFFTDKKYNVNPPFFEISGTTDKQSEQSLYKNIEQMAQIIRHPSQWKKAVIRQLVAFLPIISGNRMMFEYLNMRFKKEK